VIPYWALINFWSKRESGRGQTISVALLCCVALPSLCLYSSYEPISNRPGPTEGSVHHVAANSPETLATIGSKRKYTNPIVVSWSSLKDFEWQPRTQD
jgi:hypothetical protein